MHILIATMGMLAGWTLNSAIRMQVEGNPHWGWPAMTGIASLLCLVLLLAQVERKLERFKRETP